jgi:hypothetical protein
VVTRESILKLQEAIIQVETEAPEPNHYFADGLYLRELSIPEGMLLVGATHKKEHFLIITKGSMVVVSEFGESIMEAGDILVSPAGSKRAILALEDTTMVTTHLNEDNEQDMRVLENTLVNWDNAQLMRDEVRGLLT